MVDNALADIVEKYPFLKGFRQVGEEEFDELIDEGSDELTLTFVATANLQLTHLLIDGRDDNNETKTVWYEHFAANIDDCLIKIIDVLVRSNHSNELKTLAVSNVELTLLPESIGCLEQLVRLDVDRNKLTKLPESLWSLQYLKELIVHTNKLTELPQQLGLLQSLTKLNVDENQLSALPDSLGQLQSLTRLDAEGNKLTTLPDSLGQLQSLTELDVDDNQLTTLPDSLGQLQSLTELNVDDNQLTALPDSLCQLQNLTELYVRRNQLTALPDSLGQLHNLTQLGVDRNQLTSLPDSLGQLQNLTQLDVDNNQLTVLPGSLGQLQSLTALYVENNQLTALPDSLRQLKAIEHFLIASNPISADIHELAYSLNAQSRIRYLLEIQKPQTTQLNEAKVLVLGDERVGKTSLINRIFGRPMDSNQASTMGINIESLLLDCGIKVNIWDFAGQEVTHQTHQFFLSARSLYLLVVDGQKEDDSSKTLYWLNTITATAGKKAPIVVLANKMDLNPGFVFDLHRFKDEFNIVDVLYVSANDEKAANLSQHSITDLKTTITEHVAELKDVSLKFPPSWLAVKNELEQQKQKVDFVEASQYEDICKQSGVIEHEWQNALLDVLNQIGTVVSYQDHDTLDIMQIINPLWVTEGVYKILRAEQVSDNQAILTREQFKQIFAGNDKYAKPRHYKWLEELLKKFELAFSIDTTETESNALLIPARLKPNQPDFDIKHYQSGLNFRFEYTDILKPHLISRFIVQMHQYITKMPVPYWKRGVFLTHETANAVVISDEDKKTITIAVDSAERAGKELLTIIRHCIRRINGEHLKVKEQVPVVEKGQVLDFVDYKLLLSAEEQKQPTAPVMINGEYQYLNVAELIDGYRINDDTRFDHDKFLTDLRNIIARQTENRADIVKEDEDATNRRLRTALLDCKYTVADQSQGGNSAHGENPGERDIVIRNKETGVAEVIIEAQNIKTFNKANIREHYQRIAKYDTLGGSISVLLSYVKAPDFTKKVEQYCDLFDDYAQVQSEHSNIVMGESRLGKRRVRHFLVNFCRE